MMKVLMSLCLILVVIFCKQPFCQSNQLAFKDSCLSQCPENTAFTTRNGINQCQECDLMNFWILKEDRSGCVCAKQTYLDRSNNWCVPCHYTCLTCNGPLTENCQTCDTRIPQTFRYKQGGSCLCHQGYYDDKTLQSTKCLKCHRDCESCTGPDDSQCVKCGVGRIKNNLGLCICINNFVQDSNGKCYCPYTVMPDGSCRNMITQCGYNQESSYIPPVISKMISVADIATPDASRVKFEGLCSCRKGLVRIKGQCGSCQVNQIFNQRSGRCQCAAGGSRIKGDCFVCPSNQSLNKKTGQCVCRKNEQKAADGSCVKCPSQSVYSAEQGKCICIFNYYEDPFSGRCRKCNKRSDASACTDAVNGLDKVRKLDIFQIRDRIFGPLSHLIAIGPSWRNNTLNATNFPNLLANDTNSSAIPQVISPIFGGNQRL